MRNSFKILALVIALSHSSPIYAQLKTFEWYVPMCRYTGTYDSKKYTEERLEGSRQLCHSYLLNLPLFTYALNPANPIKANRDTLDKKYFTLLKQIKKLKIVETDYWEQIRKGKIQELKDLRMFYTTFLRGYSDPQLLLEISKNDTCEYLIALLEGGDKLLAAWKNYAEIRSKRNTDPERILKEYYFDKIDSPDKMQFARVMVMRAWSEHSARRPFHIPDEPIREEFKKLFENVKEDCMIN